MIKNYSLASIVNEGKEWSINKFEKTQMNKIFDHIYIFGIIDLGKADKEIFEYVLKQIDATPQECIFIDDLEVNYKGAEKLGRKSICFKNTIQLNYQVLYSPNLKESAA
jgi:FMN phosphatase YigB (HAD superfamily)